MTIHPKTSGAAIGTSLGVLITAVLSSISGIHLAPEVYAAITSFLGTFGAWLVPSPTPTTGPAVTSRPPAAVTEVRPASTAPPSGGGSPSV